MVNNKNLPTFGQGGHDVMAYGRTLKKWHLITIFWRTIMSFLLGTSFLLRVVGHFFKIFFGGFDNPQR
jgi:uncharacterized phage infection (PIP) family protein YhgE